MKHGGSIDVQSEPGKGTCMTVFLPSERQTGYVEEQSAKDKKNYSIPLAWPDNKAGSTDFSSELPI